MGQITRRGFVLAAGAGVAFGGALGLTACARTADDLPEPLRAGLAREDRLIAAYAAALARHPVLAPAVADLADHHRAHRAELRRLGGLPVEQDPDEADDAADDGVPDTPAAALLALVAAEQAAAEAGRATSLDQVGEQAGTFAAIAAAEAGHAALLARPDVARRLLA